MNAKYGVNTLYSLYVLYERDKWTCDKNKSLSPQFTSHFLNADNDSICRRLCSSFPFFLYFFCGSQLFFEFLPSQSDFNLWAARKKQEIGFSLSYFDRSESSRRIKKDPGDIFLSSCLRDFPPPFTPWRFRLSDDLFENTSFAVETSLKWSENAIRSCITIHRRVLLC